MAIESLSADAAAAAGAAAVGEYVPHPITPAGVVALKKQLAKHLQKSLVKGDTWYLIDARWNKQLKKFLDTEGAGAANSEEAKVSAAESNGAEGASVDLAEHPGHIDNSTLFVAASGTKNDNDSSCGSEDNIREHMMDELDYVVVPEEAWKLLVGEFGLTPGQKPIARKVVEHGMFVKHCRVEVYKNDFLLAENSNLTNTIKKKFSKADTMEDVITTMRDLFNINSSVSVRLWVKYTSNTFEQLGKLDQTVQDAGLFTGQLIVIEKQNEDGSWPRETAKESVNNGEVSTSNNILDKATSNDNNWNSNKPASSGAATPNKNSSSSPPPPQAVSSTSTNSNRRPNNFNNSVNEVSPSSSGTQGADKTQPGLCGLSNLGNTCFMNSIIQGLSNTPPIMEYFACDNYIEDINEDNPLGMRGEIARTFGEVIEAMWSGKYSYLVPRNFKGAVGRFAPQFSGYQQQDSQELLTFLLDGLHEDLNRVRKKPYTEIKDSGGRPDDEVAAEAWEVYKKRNDSVILDLFHGLLKSTVVCPECPKVSVVFDPFCYLSLPLPVRKERQIEVFLVFMDQSRVPTQYKVTCPKSGCMRDLCEALSKLSPVQIPPERMVVTDVYNHRFHKIYGPEEMLSSILERDDIFVYEVPTSDKDDPNVAVTPIYLREKKSSQSYSPSNLFGQPLLLGVPRNLDYESLYSHVVSSLSRCIAPPAPDDTTTWWKTAKPAVNGDADSAMATDETAETNDEDATNGNNNNPANGENEEEEEEEEEDDERKGPPKMFVMNLVNSYGNAQLEELRNDGQPLKIGKHYLSLDWHPKAKELFYNEKAAEEVAQDESFLQKAASPKKQVVSLSECLELYTTKEKLGENNTWRCPDCKKEQQATKKFDLWSLPAVLVISLKRFSFNRYWRDKLDTQVDFPVHGLDLSPYIINKNHGPALYDLIAVSNHYGGMGGGHYTAYAKNKDDGKWYYFDDSSVTLSAEKEVVTKAAYVLFYLRRDMSEEYSLKSESNRAASSGNCCNGNRQMGPADVSSEEDMDIN